jgi:RND family efflux transporter MFP subunit
MTVRNQFAKQSMARIRRGIRLTTAVAAVLFVALLSSCGGPAKVRAQDSASEAEVVSVGVAKVSHKTLERTLTVSSELVPFQQIDVYAKEAGYVKELYVDYGSRVKAGQLMATLEIPELEMQLKQDTAAVQYATDREKHAENELSRMKAQAKVQDLEFNRLSGVAKAQPGLVAQQEVDDAEGKHLSAEAQAEAAEASVESAKSDQLAAQAKLEHDQALFDYSKITAPFTGVVTQRYANLGTLMQSGTGSSTQVLPLVQLSQEDLFRLAIPVPESFVRYIHLGDAVNVRIASLGKTFPGKVARFSVEVTDDTRTMHTEVDVPNKDGLLVPGLYAEATVVLEKQDHAVAVPLQAVDHDGNATLVEVVDAGGKIESRHVTLGLQTATDAEVVSGLAPGEMIVVSDRSGLKAGQKVNPKMVELLEYDDGADK